MEPTAAEEEVTEGRPPTSARGDAEPPTSRQAYGASLVRWLRRNAFVLVLVAIGTALAVGETQLFVVGVIVGTVLGLGALGLTVTYGILRFPNLGHGMYMVVGGYLAFFLLTGQIRRSVQVFGDIVVPWNLGALPQATKPILGLSFGYGLVLALIVAAVVTAGMSVVLDRWVYAKFRRRRLSSPLMLAIVSFGVTYVLIGVVDIVWGLQPRYITTDLFPAHRYPFEIKLKNDQLVVFVGAIVCTVAAYWFLFKTRLGRVMRAMSSNPDLARISGIEVERVVRYNWILVGLLAGAAGTLLALVSPLNPYLGLALLLPLFAAATVGGLGNPIGALVGGLIVGIAQECSVAFFAPGYKVGVAFLILVVVLLFRPSGILGERT